MIAFTIGIGNAEYGYGGLAMDELRCVADSGPSSQSVDDRVMMIGSFEQTEMNFADLQISKITMVSIINFVQRS